MRTRIEFIRFIKFIRYTRILQAALVLIQLSISFKDLRAQDHIYSQFYNAPNYLNPALNGQFEGDLRLNMIYRSQWTNISGPLTYYSFSADYAIPEFNGGIGLLATSSSEGTAYLRKNNISGIYSYSVGFNNAILSLGIQAGVTNRRIDESKLVFRDQLDRNGIIRDGESSAYTLTLNNRLFFDSGAGANLVVGKFMLGAAAQHLNQPDESFTGSRAKLPIRYNGHASYRLNLDYYDDENSPVLIPSVLFYKQGQAQSFSLGAQLKNRRMNVGLWYRGEGSRQDAIVVSLILDIFNRRDSYDKVRVGISHDATTSKLNYTNTSGSTEGAITWETSFPNRASNGGGLGNRYNFGKRCYDFY